LKITSLVTPKSNATRGDALAPCTSTQAAGSTFEAARVGLVAGANLDRINGIYTVVDENRSQRISLRADANALLNITSREPYARYRNNLY
jgi:hypothetical protein